MMSARADKVCLLYCDSRKVIVISIPALRSLLIRYAFVSVFTAFSSMAIAEEQVVTHAVIDGSGPGWLKLTKDDFVDVNTSPDTWTWNDDGVSCTGKPVGVIRSQKRYKNMELVATWRHLKSGGNSGIFLWASDEALTGLKPDSLPPGGIEVQVLDHGYREEFIKKHGKEPDWFTTDGDVFSVGKSTMKPFYPAGPGSTRCFPRKRLSKGINEWNHYYVRAINGEVRLWVNGEEVSGGYDCQPSQGYLCLESEGAPVEFKGLRIRELP